MSYSKDKAADYCLEHSRQAFDGYTLPCALCSTAQSCAMVIYNAAGDIIGHVNFEKETVGILPPGEPKENVRVLAYWNLKKEALGDG